MKKLLNTRYTDTQVSLALLLIRIVFGGMMILNHGWGKLSNFDTFSAKVEPFLGIPSAITALMVIFAEVFCAGFLIFGFMTRLASIPLIICMSVAFFDKHSGKLSGQGNGEMALLFLAVFVTILLVGAGKYSLDKTLGK